MAVDLQRLAFKGLVDKTAIERNDIDYVIAGSVIQEVRTSNIQGRLQLMQEFPILSVDTQFPWPVFLRTLPFVLLLIKSEPVTHQLYSSVDAKHFPTSLFV